MIKLALVNLALPGDLLRLLSTITVLYGPPTPNPNVEDFDGTNRTVTI